MTSVMIGRLGLSSLKKTYVLTAHSRGSWKLKVPEKTFFKIKQWLSYIIQKHFLCICVTFAA